MKVLVFAMLAICTVAAQAASVDMHSMDAATAKQYVLGNTRIDGQSFGDQNLIKGPTDRETVENGTAFVRLNAYIDPHTKHVSVFASVGVFYTANLWAFYRSAVLDDGSDAKVSNVTRNFSDCEEDGCSYIEVMSIDVPASEMKSHTDKSLGFRLYGDNAVTTVTLPAGYVGGFEQALSALR